MKKYILPALLLFSVFAANAQNKPDSVTFLLHKFEQHIGKEVYRVSKTNNEITYTVDFKFVDRGSPVPLKAELKLTTANEPISLKIKGNTARSATINDTIGISGTLARIKVNDSSYQQQLTTLAFPVASYAPGTVQ